MAARLQEVKHVTMMAEARRMAQGRNALEYPATPGHRSRMPMDFGTKSNALF
jgi:hypothetical protein